ncbi:MAG TPA: hypothetical protein VJ755_04300 [Gemmatimonadales bacterium]|nr:hypothetical protein [Gemmatimonadales bacterium]
MRDTVRNARRRDDQIGGTGLDLTLSHDESGLSFEHYIEFVGVGVRVHRLALSWLETVEPDEQAVRAEAVDLRHRGRAKCRALEQVLNHFWGFHGRFLAPDGRYTQGAT